LQIQLTPHLRVESVHVLRVSEKEPYVSYNDVLDQELYESFNMKTQETLIKKRMAYD
jgi:hypothetical protein